MASLYGGKHILREHQFLDFFGVWKSGFNNVLSSLGALYM